MVGLLVLAPILAYILKLLFHFIVEGTRAILWGEIPWYLFGGVPFVALIILASALIVVAIGLSSFLVLRVRDDKQVEVYFLGKACLVGKALGMGAGTALYILLHEDSRSLRFPRLSLFLLLGIMINEYTAVVKVPLSFHRGVDRKDLVERFGEYSGAFVATLW